jgi:hypothetical protein
MPKHTNDTDLTECEKDVVFAVDVLDVNRSLKAQQVPFTQTLKDCGYMKTKCSYLQGWVNQERGKKGKQPIAAGTIKPSTTIQQVVDHVC